MSTPYPRFLAAFVLLLCLRVSLQGEERPIVGRLGKRHFTTAEDRRQWSETLAFAPDGQTLASLGTDRVIRLWDLSGQKERRKLQLSAVPGRCLAFAPDGRLLAFCTADHTIHLWDSSTGREERVLQDADDNLSSLVFSPDGTRLAAAGRPAVAAGKYRTIRVWNVKNGREIRTLRRPCPFDVQVIFRPDATTLASIGNRALLWDITTGKQRLPAHLETGLSPIRMTPNDVFPSPGPAGWAGGIAAPNGRLLAAFARDGVHLLDTMIGGERCHVLAGSVDRAHLTFSADSRVLLGVDSQNAVHLWETAGGKELLSLKRRDLGSGALALSPDGVLLARAKDDGTIELIDVRPTDWARVKAQGLRTWQLDWFWDHLLSPDGYTADYGMWMLAAVPKQSLPFVKKRLPRISSEKHIGQLIRDLDSDVYATRETASTELRHIGATAEPALARAVTNHPTRELRWRIKDLLEDIETKRIFRPTGERLRGLRAIWVLERMSTKEALATLNDLARGSMGAWETREAQEAARRLRLRLGKRYAIEPITERKYHR